MVGDVASSTTFNLNMASSSLLIFSTECGHGAGAFFGAGEGSGVGGGTGFLILEGVEVGGGAGVLTGEWAWIESDVRRSNGSILVAASISLVVPSSLILGMAFIHFFLNFSTSSRPRVESTLRMNGRILPQLMTVTVTVSLPIDLLMRAST